MAGTDLSHLFVAFLFPGHYEWLILLVLGLLIFGRRLPEVGRSLGRGIVEFKRGIKGIEDDIDDESSKATPPPERIEQRSADVLNSPQGPAEPLTEVDGPQEVASGREADDDAVR